MSTEIEAPPAPLAMCVVRTNSGEVTVPCEPVGEYLAIVPTFNVDEEGRSSLCGFSVVERRSGLAVVDGDGCVWCARLVAEELDELIDWSTLTSDDVAADWVETLSDETRERLVLVQNLDWLCDAEPCHDGGESR